MPSTNSRLIGNLDGTVAHEDSGDLPGILGTGSYESCEMLNAHPCVVACALVPEQQTSLDLTTSYRVVSTILAHLSRVDQHLQCDYTEADALYLRAIEIGEKTVGPDHPDIASRLNRRAGVLRLQVRIGQRSRQRSRRCIHAAERGKFVVFTIEGFFSEAGKFLSSFTLHISLTLPA